MVRRLAVVAGLAVLTGCSLKDALSGHQDVVATAAGQELTVERVATMIAPAKAVPLRREVVDRVAELWVDYQLLAQAVAGGDSLLDSSTVMAANWPLVMQTLANGYHDSVVARARPSDAQVDSAYNAGDYRYVQHILVSTRGDTSAAGKAAKRRVAEGYLAQVRRGTNFGQLANRVTDDPGSRGNGGAYFMGRGAMVKPFEDEAFALQPGGLSQQPVETAFGYHILYRPPLADVRDSFVTKLEDIMLNRGDSIFLDSLTNKTGVQVRSRAPQIVKSVASNLRAAKGRSRTLATWRGGRLTEGEFAVWLQAFPPQTRGQVGQAPDSVLVEFIKSIARNEQIIAAAQERNIGLSPVQRDSMRARYRDELQAMLAGMGVAPESLATDSAGGGNRSEIAARRIDAYFTAITNSPGSRQYFEVPPFLADVLRERSQWQINAAGVDRALERARTLRGPENPTGTMTPAPLQQSPGGPPIPGARPPQSPPQ